MHLLVVLALVSVAFGDLSDHWMLFKKTHHKNYNAAEEVQRRMTFEQNAAYIQKHNLEADMGRHSYWLGMNEYGDLTDDEYAQFLKGFLYNETRPSDFEFLAPNNIALPDTVDWRTKGYVTGVKNQGHCGSCWSFSATGSLEGQHFKKTGQLVSLSEQNLVDCSRAEGNHGCKGGSMVLAFKYIKENQGIDTEASYPYEAKDMTCRFKRADIGATDNGYVHITSKDEMALQQAVGTVGPISVAIDASRKTFRMYKHGVYDDPTCSSTKLDHGVLAVGYGTESGMDYWLVKNSWGMSYGDQGYVKMSRNKGNQCGIATSATYPTV